MAPDFNRLRDPLAVQLAAPQGRWRPLIDAWLSTDGGARTQAFVDERVASGAVVHPARPVRALEVTPFETVRVVIVGQDPYHGAGQAEGLAFSVPVGVRIPPSLRNIFAELQRDLGIEAPRHGHLLGWARQGVLLLNTALTVESGQAGSHSRIGWEALTFSIIEAVASDEAPKVFMLWGAYAQRLTPVVRRFGERHRVLECNHPSPLSCTRGPSPFRGSGHFSLAARFLAAARPQEPAIDWRLP